MKNRTYFKIISSILIQTFLILDISWAAAGQAIVRTNLDSTLSPSINIDNIDLEIAFDGIISNDFNFDIDEVKTAQDEFVGTMAVANITTNVTSGASNLIMGSGIIGGNSLLSEPIQPPPNPSDNLISVNYPVGTIVAGSDDEKQQKDKSNVIGFMDAGEYNGISLVNLMPQDKQGSINPAELGLPEKETGKLFRILSIISRGYFDEKFWPGFIKFSIGISDSKNAVMQIDANDNKHLAIIQHAIPSLIKLMEESPRLFRELVEALFVHEGGISGHGAMWELKPEDIDWFNIEAVMKIIYEGTVKRSWPKVVYDRANRPSFDLWRPALHIIWDSLKLVGFNPMKPEPWGISWKESQANLGMVHEKGVRSVALWLWYSRDFHPPEGQVADVEQELAENFAFLEMQGITLDQINKEIEKVRSDYQAEKTRTLGSKITTTLTSIASGLLVLVTALPTLGATASQSAVQTSGFGGVDVLAIAIAGSILLAGKFIWDRLPFFKSVEQRTVQLVNRTISRKDPSSLRTYYQSANINDKIKIVNIAAQELKGKSDKTQLALFENIFLDGLNERARNVTLNMQTKVKSLFKQRINSEIKLREMISILNAVVLETGINVYQGYPRTVELKLTKIINSLVRADNLNADSFIGAIKKDSELDASIDRMLVSEFGQAQRNAQVRVLFNNMLKQIIITRETQNAALSQIIAQAIQQVLPQEITGGDSMFPEIAILVGRLALAGKLHDQDVFFKQAQSMSAISRVMDAEQTRALHNAIVNLLESGYRDSDKTKIELVAAEFDKAGIAHKIGALTSGYAAVILSSTNGNNSLLMRTPLSEIGAKIKGAALDEKISRSVSFSNADKTKVKEIISNLDKTLINNMALGIVFEDVNPIVEKELEKLGFKNINSQRARLVLVNTLSKGALFNDLQAVQAGEFVNAVEDKVYELRYVSAVGLKHILEVGGGTGRMVAELKNYFKEVPPRRLVLRNIMEDLRQLVEVPKAVEKALPLAVKEKVTETKQVNPKPAIRVAPDLAIDKQSFHTQWFFEYAI